MAPSFRVELFSRTSVEPSLIPTVDVPIPSGYKLIGGGARVNWQGMGSLLTASYPDEANNRWVAEAKSHGEKDPCTITAWAVALHDPHDEWDVEIEYHHSGKSNLPRAHVRVREGYTLTGGGARVSWNHKKDFGNLLTASFPRDNLTWEARSKAHGQESENEINVYAIGVKPKVGPNLLTSEIFSSESKDPESLPSHIITVPSEYIVTCGGAVINWEPFGQGSLLTAIYPENDHQWMGKGKDHYSVETSTITVFAIGIKNQ